MERFKHFRVCNSLRENMFIFMFGRKFHGYSGMYNFKAENANIKLININKHKFPAEPYLHY